MNAKFKITIDSAQRHHGHIQCGRSQCTESLTHKIKKKKQNKNVTFESGHNHANQLTHVCSRRFSWNYPEWPIALRHRDSFPIQRSPNYWPIPFVWTPEYGGHYSRRPDHGEPWTIAAPADSKWWQFRWFCSPTTPPICTNAENYAQNSVCHQRDQWSMLVHRTIRPFCQRCIPLRRWICRHLEWNMR